MQFAPVARTARTWLRLPVSRVLAVAGLLLLLTSCSLPRWPVHGTMTSPFGLRFRGWSPDLHEGVDISARQGTPVRAMQDGVVVHAGPRGGYGLCVIIAHGGSTRTLYGHLSRIEVRRGQRIRNGDLLGAVGRTGNATGSHLHFEVWRWGRPEDPVPLLGGPPPR